MYKFSYRRGFRALLLAGVTLIASQVFGFGECTRYEAQFLARVRIVVHDLYNGSCLAFLDLDYSKGDMFHPNQICPLSVDQALATSVFFPQCTIKEGQTISGVLVLHEGAIWLVVE
ncbi:MAG: hypothetical protein NZ480_00105 [Bdellovibrionaceae bacterium]|nr:hypothetical protein [Pseudobdellovibrionaceae bacterium]MDW8189542.1 hypothetical protein [Pseudobdellovibrionaceae bacterium]